MSDPLNSLYCIGNNEYKTMRDLIGSYRQLEAAKSPVICGQTIIFWMLQLQLIEIKPLALKSLHYYLLPDSSNSLRLKTSDKWSDDDSWEMVTEIALHLSGLV